MAGLKKDPELELAVKANRAGRRRKSRKPWEPDASLAPGTTHNDLGLGPKLADRQAEPVWRFTIYRLNSPRRTGVSRCATYTDANDAAGDILGEYLALAGVPAEGRKVYTCDVTGLGPNEGQTGGAEGRDWV